MDVGNAKSVINLRGVNSCLTLFFLAGEAGFYALLQRGEIVKNLTIIVHIRLRHIGCFFGHDAPPSKSFSVLYNLSPELRYGYWEKSYRFIPWRTRLCHYLTDLWARFAMAKGYLFLILIKDK
jgi:hypothetical protein